jgi:hypothetical protein
MLSVDDLLNLTGVDLRRFLYDNFLSTEQVSWTLTGTGDAVGALDELRIETGALDGSSAKVWYNSPCFNPQHSTLMFKAQVDSILSVFAFIGVKSSTADPTPAMGESHAGFMIETVNNIPCLYVTSGQVCNGAYSQQKIRVPDWDPTKYLIYRIVKDRFATRPQAVITSVFDGIEKVEIGREWTKDVQTGSAPCNDQDHYFMAYISNTVGLNKALRINHVLYAESYAD